MPNNASAISSENKDWVKQTILEYEEWGFVKRVKNVPKCVLPLQVSVDPDGKRRLIHDESPLNKFVSKKKFKMDGWEVIFDYSADAQAGIKFDMKKYYHQMEIAQEEQTYFGFTFVMEDGDEPVIFCFTVMTFGYTRAPFIAKAIFKPLIKKWRMLHIFVAVFFDDGCGVSDCPIFLKRAALQIQCDLLRAGLVPGFEKCQWSPRPMLDWVGFRWDFQKRGLSVIPRRIEHFKLCCQKLIENWPKVSFRKVARFNGMISSMIPVLEGKAKLHTRMLQLIVNVKHAYEAPWNDDIFCDKNQDVMFETGLNELKFWEGNFDMLNFRPFKLPKPSAVGWSDASNLACGGIVFKLKPDTPAHYNPVTADNLLLPVKRIASLVALRTGAPWRVADVDRDINQVVTVRDGADLNPIYVEKKQFVHKMFTPDEMFTDSNERELMGVKALISGSRETIQDSVLSLQLDSLNAVTIIQNGSNKYRLQKYALHIENLCREWRVKLRPVWIPRDLNKLADIFSNMVDFDDYSASKVLYLKAQYLANLQCDFDRFANNYNTKTAMFNSASHCVGSSGVDAFNYNWHGWINWLFPPPRLIIKAVNHLKLCNSVGVLLTPLWRSDPFWPYMFSKSIRSGVLRYWTLPGQNAFVQGSDKSSYFGPHFNSGIVVWKLDFRPKD